MIVATELPHQDGFGGVDAPPLLRADVLSQGGWSAVLLVNVDVEKVDRGATEPHGASGKPTVHSICRRPDVIG